MKYKFLIAAASIFLMGCSSNPSGVVIDASQRILYLNENGDNLFDPDLNLINPDMIKVYYVLNGKKTEINRPNYDNPKMCSIIAPETSNPDDVYCFAITVNIEDIPDENYVGEYTTTTILDFGIGKEDTIQAVLRAAPNGSIFLQRSWYNGVPTGEFRPEGKPKFNTYDYVIVKQLP